MEAGGLTLLKLDNVHALFNATDEDIMLVMFGGQD